MRELTGHKVNPVNDLLDVFAIDGPGPGGASHSYEIKVSGKFPSSAADHRIEFQKGPISEVGINGVTQETLLTILIDRLEGFQSGQYASHLNAEALYHLQQAQKALQLRTKERMARGVEGTHQV
jgi:hypothetical protein